MVFDARLITLDAAGGPARHDPCRARDRAAFPAADRCVIYTRYLVDKYALIMHTYAHENNTEHTGCPFEESSPTDGCSREDIIGAFGA
jgi:hypothetical protein